MLHAYYTAPPPFVVALETNYDAYVEAGRQQACPHPTASSRTQGMVMTEYSPSTSWKRGLVAASEGPTPFFTGFTL